MLGLTTVIATVVGISVGNWLSSKEVTGPYGQAGWWIIAIVLIGLAVAGWMTSLIILRLPAADPSRRFPYDLFGQTVRDLKILATDKAMLRVALGIMFFWSLGMMAHLNIDQFAFEGGDLAAAGLAVAGRLGRRGRTGKRDGRHLVERKG